jgi:hypothetical protein
MDSVQYVGLVSGNRVYLVGADMFVLLGKG